MQAIILAAGLGVRLQPFTQTKPKCLLEVNGVTILENCLNNLAQVNCKKIVIVVGHLKDQIINHVGNVYKTIPVEYVCAPDYEKTNNIVSLYHARHHFIEDTMLVESDV